MNVNPSSDRSCAHWTVNMFNAVLEILYAGVGASLNAGAWVIDPNVEVLKDSISRAFALIRNSGCVELRFLDEGHLHVYNFLELTLS